MHICCTILFFSKIWGFTVKNCLYIYNSKYCPSLATTCFHLSGSIRIPRRKNWLAFETIHKSIDFFWLLHKNGSVGLPILTFPNTFRTALRHGMEHCYATETSRRIAAVCLSMLGSNASIAFDIDCLWLFQYDTTLCRAGLTKNRA